jgi:hypothetical protein
MSEVVVRCAPLGWSVVLRFLDNVPVGTIHDFLEDGLNIHNIVGLAAHPTSPSVLPREAIVLVATGLTLFLIPFYVHNTPFPMHVYFENGGRPGFSTIYVRPGLYRHDLDVLGWSIFGTATQLDWWVAEAFVGVGLPIREATRIRQTAPLQLQVRFHRGATLVPILRASRSPPPSRAPSIVERAGHLDIEDRSLLQHGPTDNMNLDLM